MDAAGNSAVRKAGAISLDTTPPEIAVSAPADGEVFVAELSTLTVGFGAVDALDPSPALSAVLTDLEEGTTLQAAAGQGIDPSDLDDGFWSLAVEAEDWVGNRSTEAVVFRVIHDILPPRTGYAIGAASATEGT